MSHVASTINRHTSPKRRTRSRSSSHARGPAWKIAELFPKQGHWTEAEYLALDDDEHLIEFNDGVLEFLPMPSVPHQMIAQFLFLALHAFVKAGNLGKVFYDGIKTKLGEGQIRLPDIMIALNDRSRQHTEHYFHGADLVVEVVSKGPGNRKRDLVEKRILYAAAGIAEYWIVDPKRQVITVLRNADGKYLMHGEFGTGQKASSVLLRGFEVSVAEVFAEAQN